MLGISVGVVLAPTRCEVQVQIHQIQPALHLMIDLRIRIATYCVKRGHGRRTHFRHSGHVSQMG